MFELRAKSTKETDILMYGSISEWGRIRAEDFVNKIADVKAKGYEKAKLKINCPGGSIFEGIAIMSQMGSQEIFIHGVVEGIAASMGSAILQGCHKRSMVKGTRLMVHQGSGGVFGSSNYIRNYADLLESLNKTLAEIYAKRSKRDVDYILKNWMAEGKDTWFTPEKALEEGLIDEIIEGNVKPFEKEQASLMEMAAHYNQFITTEDSTMTKEEREKLVKELGLKAEATDADILTAVAELKKPATTKKETPTDPQPAEGKNALVEGVVALAKGRGITDEGKLKSIRKIAEYDVQAAIDVLPQETKEPAATININDLIKGLKDGTSGGASAERKDWKYSDWSKKDPAGLLEMAKTKFDEWAKLFAAEYGYTPTENDLKGLK